MAPAGNQPATEKTDEPKLGLERVVKGGEQNRPEGRRVGRWKRRAGSRSSQTRHPYGKCREKLEHASLRRWPELAFAGEAVTRSGGFASFGVAPILSRWETADWSAVCGKTARTVRREGRL